MRRLQLLIEPSDVVEELEGEVVADLFDRRLGMHLGEERIGVRGVEFLGDSARCQLGKRACSRQTTRVRWSPMSVLRLAKRRSTSTVADGSTRRSPGDRRAATATESASFGSFLFERPVPSTRTREANVAGTSTTSSPAPTSCWARR